MYAYISKFFVHFLPGQFYGLRLPQDTTVECVSRDCNDFRSTYLSDESQMLKLFDTSHRAHEDGETASPGSNYTIVAKILARRFPSPKIHAMFFLCHKTQEIIAVLTRSGEKLVVSSTLLCRGLGGVRIVHQIGLFGEIANRVQQGWKFFEIRPNFARKLVDVQAQLVKDLSGIVTTPHFFSPAYVITFFSRDDRSSIQKYYFTVHH
jgi:hypothetical protein